MTGVNAATIKIAIEVDDKGSVKIRQLGRSTQDAGDQADRSFKKAGRSLGDFDQKVSAAITKLAKFMAVTLAAAAAAGVAALALVSKQSVKLASDLEETQNKFNVVFRGMTGQAEAWAKVLQDSYIMTREESKRYLASVQDLLVPMGMAREEAGALSFEIVKLSADMGSFNNVPTAQVMADIQSALVGNYETMKKYGVVLNATTVQEKALAMGLAATKDELTAAHRAQAAYQLILAGSADAIGDISRSSESYANQMRLLNKNITEMKTTLGEALLPVLSKMLVDFNTWFKLNEDLIRQNIEEWGKKVATVIETIGKMAGWTLERLYNFSNFIAILDAIKEGELSFWKAATMGPKEAEVWLERYAARQRLANLEMASSHLTANELAVSHGKVAEAATASGDAQVKAAGEATKALGKLDKAILDTGRSYNLQVAAYMEGTDVLTRNIIDRSDQMEAEERERMARVSTAVEEFYGDIYDMAEDHADGVRQLNELLVNDMGRIFDTYINDVLHGQIRSVKDLFEGLFKSILDMFTRLLSQMAANSLVDALFGKGASGGLTLGSLTTGGGLLDKVLGGGSLAKNAASAGKWLGGLLGIGGAASAPALLAPGAAGAALYPAVGVATSGTGYAVGMGGMGTGAAATTGAGATTTSSGGMALGLAPWMAPAAVGAIGLGLWAKFVFGDKKPTTTELMNQMALTPEDYAFAIGTAFTEAMDPVYGILQNHMMNAQGTALTTWNQFETEFRDVQTRIYDHTTGQWQDLAYSGQVLFAMMRGDVVSEMDAMAMEVETGIAGLAEQLVSASEQLVSASEQLVSASEQMQTGLDKARGAMQDMGVSGGYLKRAMDLADRALQSAGNSTEALQAYLEGLGLSAD
ncbi:MAG: hypothetical protein M0P55_15175, partial [Clostridiales bacterium]|nr:hypothetical protein [Clostridiales bacterium]